jgi:hypothetical protein
MKSIGFKEWAPVCQALGRGKQSIILRKGGIAEGRNGFSFQHDEFFLFPTFFHEQVTKVRTGERSLPVSNGMVTVRFYAKVECALRIDSLETAELLGPLHIISADTVRERFDYGRNGLNVAFVRIFELAQPWVFSEERRFRGCRSWIELPEAPETEIRPVLSEKTQASRRAYFESIVRGGSA